MKYCRRIHQNLRKQIKAIMDFLPVLCYLSVRINISALRHQSLSGAVAVVWTDPCIVQENIH